LQVIESYKLVREMFRLLLRQYDGVGEAMRALQKTYVINSRTTKDVQELWIGLSRIRGLLPVQMSQEEEELMRELLWKMVNNHSFFQHPDLMRNLRVHENVMAIMMNTLGANTRDGRSFLYLFLKTNLFFRAASSSSVGRTNTGSSSSFRRRS
jgi:ryanodine receptor 2